MHALSRIHHALRAAGSLLDVHPQPENVGLEVRQEGRVVFLGQLDGAEDIRDVRQARTRLGLVERRGWFVTERQMIFDMLEHYTSVRDWLERRAREGDTSIISEAVLHSAHQLMAHGRGELVIRNQVRASLLRRLP